MLEKETPVHVFSCDFCEIFKNVFFIEHLRANASGLITASTLLEYVCENTESSRDVLKEAVLKPLQN